MDNLASVGLILLALTTGGYLAATAVYWYALLSSKKFAGHWATKITLVAFLLHAAWFGVRTYQLGYLPLYSGYDFSATFACGIVFSILIFGRLSQRRDMGTFAVPVALILLVYAWTLPRPDGPLVLIFKSPFLTFHILTAAVAYSAFAITFAASCLYLVKPRSGKTVHMSAGDLSLLDRIAYMGSIVGLPIMTVCIVTGAIWAEQVWGRYWTWDPKETWSLITWLVFSAYLHVRYHRGWNPRKAAILAIIGFLTVFMNFIGVQIIYQYQETVFAPLMQ